MPVTGSQDRPLRNRDRLSPLLSAIFSAVATESGAEGAARGILATVWDPSSNAMKPNSFVPFYQIVPVNQPYPYIVQGSVTETAWNTKTCPGSEFLVMLAVVSQYEGITEANQIAGALLDAMTSPALDLSASGLQLVELRPLAQASAGGAEELSDGRTKVRRIPFRARVEDTAQQVP